MICWNWINQFGFSGELHAFLPQILTCNLFHLSDAAMLAPYYNIVYQIHSICVKCMSTRLFACPKIDSPPPLSVFSTFLRKSQEALIHKWTVANRQRWDISQQQHQTPASLGSQTDKQVRMLKKNFCWRCIEGVNKNFSDPCPSKSWQGVTNDTGHPVQQGRATKFHTGHVQTQPPQQQFLFTTYGALNTHRRVRLFLQLWDNISRSVSVFAGLIRVFTSGVKIEIQNLPEQDIYMEKSQRYQGGQPAPKV